MANTMYISEGKQNPTDNWEYIRVFTNRTKAIESDDGVYFYFRVYQYLVADKRLILESTGVK